MIIYLGQILLIGSSDQPIPDESGIYLILHRIGFITQVSHPTHLWSLAPLFSPLPVLRQSGVIGSIVSVTLSLGHITFKRQLLS